MARKISTLALALLLIAIGCRREPESAPVSSIADDVLKAKPTASAVPQGDPLSREELDRIIIGTLEANNDFQWPMVDLRTLWSATLYNDHSVSIGYKPAGLADIDGIIHEVNIQDDK